MKKHISLTLLVVLVAALIAGLYAPTTSVKASPNTQGGVGFIRFGNATPGAQFVRVQLDSVPVANKVEHLVGYFTFNTGEHTAIFRTEGGDEIARTTFTLEPATRMTVTLVGTFDTPTLLVTTDNAAPTVRGLTRIRVVNAVVGSSALPVTLNGESIASDLAFGSYTEEIEVQAGSYSLALGDKTAMDVVLSPGRYYYLAVVGDTDTSEPELVSFFGRPYRVSGTNRFRFMNLVEVPTGADEVLYDVYVNKDPNPVYTNVDFGEATNEYVVQPGSYSFEVFAQGVSPEEGSPLASLQVDIAEDQSIFIVAAGTPEAVSLNLFSDDTNPIPVNTSRLQVINLSTAIPEFGVKGPHSLLVDQAPFGSMVSADIPGGLYALELVSADDANSVVGRAEVNAASGHLATLIIYGNEEQQWTWFNEVSDQVGVARFVHASPDAGNLDIYLNGELILSDFGFLDTTDYINLEPGDYALAVYVAGTDASAEGATPIWTDNLKISGRDLAFTMVAMGKENFRVNVYADNLELIPAGQARVRFVDAIRNVDQVSFINAANAGTLAGGLVFGQGSDNLNLEANTRTFNVNQTGVGPIYRIESFELVPGGYYSFIVVGDGTDPANVSLITLETHQ